MKEQGSYRCKAAVGNSSGGQCPACRRCESGPGGEENKLSIWRVSLHSRYLLPSPSVGNVRYLQRVARFTLERDDVVH